MFVIDQLTNGGILFGLLVVLAAAGAVCLRTGLFGRWLGVIAVLLALGSVVGAFSIAYARLQTAQAIMLSLDTLWVLVVSVLLLVRPEEALAS